MQHKPLVNSLFSNRRKLKEILTKAQMTAIHDPGLVAELQEASMETPVLMKEDIALPQMALTTVCMLQARRTTRS